MKEAGQAGRRWAWGCAVMAAVLLSACDDDDDSLGSGHDFGDNDPELVVTFGDSITLGEGVAPYPGYLNQMIAQRVENHSYDGGQSGRGAGAVGSVLNQHKPGFLVIMFGANDAINGIPTATTKENLRRIVVSARDNRTIPILCTLTPQTDSHAPYNGRVERINDAVHELGAEENIPVADVAAAFGSGEGLLGSDGLHPNPAGHQQIAATLAALF